MVATPKKISLLVELQAPAVGDLFAIVDISEAFDADKTKKITAAYLGTILPQLTGLVGAGFSTVTDLGSSGGGTVTVDWTIGNIFKVKMTGNFDLAMTDPAISMGGTIYLIGDGSLRDPVLDDDADVVWVEGGNPYIWGSTNNEVVGIVSVRINPNETPKYAISAASVGA